MLTLTRSLGAKAAALALLCLLSTALAQSPDSSCQIVELGIYANFSFCVPSNVTVIQGPTFEASYQGGKAIGTSLSIDGAVARVNLLYPYQVSDNMTQSEVKSALETYSPGLQSAVYSPISIDVSGHSALWGSYGNETFVTFQPSSSTLAAAFFEGSVRPEVEAEVLNSLQLRVDETKSPLLSDYSAQANSTAEASSVVEINSNVDANSTAEVSMPEANNTVEVNSTVGAIIPVPAEGSQASISLPEIPPSQSPVEPQGHVFRGPGSSARLARIEAAIEALKVEQEMTREKLGMAEESLAGQRESTLENLGKTKESLAGQKESTLENLEGALENMVAGQEETQERLGAAMEGLHE